MKALKILLTFVQGLLIALALAWIVRAPFAEDSPGGMAAFYRTQYVALLGVLLLTVLILLPGKIRLRRKKEPLEFIPLNGPNGDIRVSVRVAKNTVQECAAKFKAVRSLEPELSWGTDGLSVILRIEMERGQPLTTVCRDLQDSVREVFARELGIEQLREVRADIVDLVGTAPAEKPEPKSEPESKPEQGS